MDNITKNDKELAFDEVQRAIDQSRTGLEIEHHKMEFKREWYNMKSNAGKMEFLKDSCAMANSHGLDGFLVLGYDEKRKKLTGASLKDSGLRDTADLSDIIRPKVSLPFNFSYYEFKIGKKPISVLHFPPSYNKPHVLTLYQEFHTDGNVKRELRNVTFLRDNTATKVADRYDLDQMYVDRMKIIPDYNLRIDLTRFSYVPSLGANSIIIGLTIENLGRRPVAIAKIYATLTNNNGLAVHFSSIYNEESKVDKSITSNNLIVLPNQIERYVYLLFNPILHDDLHTEKLLKEFETKSRFYPPLGAIVNLSNGEKISTVIYHD